MVSMSGCVLGPMGYSGHCNNCDGCNDGGYYYGMGPGHAFRQWRRSLTCGAGCGETYYDEWYSSPPECEDPCPQFAGKVNNRSGFNGGCLDCGGGSNCGVCGVRPLRTIAGLAVGLYGKRFCGDCGYDYDDCCCGDGGFAGETVIEGTGATGGCATGNCSTNHRTNSRVANANVQRSPAHRHAMARQQTTGNAPPNPGSQVIHPAEPDQKFYRQATRLPAGQPAFRR